jgi:Effector Associated Constant Component 1
MSDGSWTDAIDVEVEVASDVFAADDDRWVDEVDRFHRELEDRLGRDIVRRDTRPIPGMKGGLASIVVSLGSAGAFTAAATAFKDWLGRAGDRSLTVRVGGQVVKVSGKNVKDDTLLETLRVAVKGA